MKKIFFYLILGLIILVLFSIFFWFNQTKYFIGRASISQQSFSVDNSYLFVSPLNASANGVEKIRITVLILSNQGLGVAGKKVALSPNKSIVLETIQGLTDSYGKVIFDASSNVAGEYYLDVIADNIKLPQKAHLMYR